MLKKIIIFGLLFSICFNIFADDEEIIMPKNVISTEGLIINSLLVSAMIREFAIITAFQYERQIMKKFSLGSRVEMFYFGEDMINFSAEVHARYYPSSDVFFLNGILGYAAFLHSFEMDAQRSLTNYFLIGAKIGWRIDFGKPGGFVLEPSFGYTLAFGKTINAIDDDYEWYIFTNEFMNALIRNMVGGPKVSICLGYRF